MVAGFFSINNTNSTNNVYAYEYEEEYDEVGLDDEYYDEMFDSDDFFEERQVA